MALDLVVPIPPGFGLLRPDDLTAVKAAVLYGDTVTVVMHLSTHMATGLLAGAPDQERAAFLRRCVDRTVIERAGYPVSDSDNAELTNALKCTMADYLQMHRDPMRLDLVFEDDVFADVSLPGGEPALIVRINPGVELFTDRLKDLVLTDPAPTLMLPASQSQVSARSTTRVKDLNADMALRLLSRLPGFRDVSLEEVIDIRSQLGEPLTRFRSAVVDLSSDDLASSNDFDVAWMSNVAPALQDIDDLVHENHYLRRLVEQLMSPTQGAVTVAGVVIGVAALRGTPEFLMAGLTAMMPPLRAAWEKRLGSENLSKQRFFFLYEISKRIQG
jgi:hypothetical protein